MVTVKKVGGRVQFDGLTGNQIIDLYPETTQVKITYSQWGNDEDTVTFDINGQVYTVSISNLDMGALGSPVADQGEFNERLPLVFSTEGSGSIPTLQQVHDAGNVINETIFTAEEYSFGSMPQVYTKKGNGEPADSVVFISGKAPVAGGLNFVAGIMGEQERVMGETVLIGSENAKEGQGGGQVALSQSVVIGSYLADMMVLNAMTLLIENSVLIGRTNARQAEQVIECVILGNENISSVFQNPTNVYIFGNNNCKSNGEDAEGLYIFGNLWNQFTYNAGGKQRGIGIGNGSTTGTFPLSLTVGFGIVGGAAISSVSAHCSIYFPFQDIAENGNNIFNTPVKHKVSLVSNAEAGASLWGTATAVEVTVLEDHNTVEIVTIKPGAVNVIKGAFNNQNYSVEFAVDSAEMANFLAQKVQAPTVVKWATNGLGLSATCTELPNVKLGNKDRGQVEIFFLDIGKDDTLNSAVLV
jgi:hypothetical protein